MRLLPRFSWFRSLLCCIIFLSFSHPTQVDLAHPVGVDGVALVWVDNLGNGNMISSPRERGQTMAYHNEEARVGVDHLGLVSGLQIPEDGRVVEEGQVDHVLTLLKLGNNMCDM